jgi:hypothetical protein
VFDLCTLSWSWHRCSQIRTSSVDWAQQSRFYLKTETESSIRNVLFWKINRTVCLDTDKTMDNVQKHNICTNVYHRHKLLDLINQEVLWQLYINDRPLSCSPNATVASYPEQDETSHILILFLTSRFNIILPTTRLSPSWSLPFQFSDQNFECIFYFSVVATCHACRILLCLIVRILSNCCDYPQTLAHLFHWCSFVKRRVVLIWSRNSLCFNFLRWVTVRRDVIYCARKIMVSFREPLSPDTQNKSFWLLFIYVPLL